ncbi:hypothetical protein M5K25_002976 [Dendrobium thyrsiflorum]|uniref:Uncharacterized protein n=1 Tax=Dendrobium thyrsiflorum TaxID=117978 RepID=A0ABD0VPM9_DENTH
MEVLPSDFPPLSSPSLFGPPRPPPPPVSYANNLSAPAAKPLDFSVSYVSLSLKLSFSSDDLTDGSSLWSLSLVGYLITSGCLPP